MTAKAVSNATPVHTLFECHNGQFSYQSEGQCLFPGIHFSMFLREVTLLLSALSKADKPG